MDKVNHLDSGQEKTGNLIPKENQRVEKIGCYSDTAFIHESKFYISFAMRLNSFLSEHRWQKKQPLKILCKATKLQLPEIFQKTE